MNDALDAIRGRRRWIVVGLLVGLLAATLLTERADRTYSSSTQLFLSVTGAPDTTDPLSADSFIQQRMTSYIQVITGKELAQQVAKDLGGRLTADDLAGKISATPIPGTVILQVQVTDTSPQRAQEIARTVAAEFENRVARLETPEGATTPTVKIETLEAPEANSTPVSPNVELNLIIGAALGLVLGVGLALMLSRLDSTVKRRVHVRDSAGTELLGRVFRDRRMARRHVLSSLDRHSASAEAYRAIRFHLRHLDDGATARVVVVASCLPREGATTVAINLAASLARSGNRVLLVDGNLRRPRVARYLGIDDQGIGLFDVLDGTVDLRTATQSSDRELLDVLGAGWPAADTDAVLDSPLVRELLGTLRESYDWVIIDAPPLLPIIDAASLSTLADGCLLVTRYGRTTQAQLAEAADRLDAVDARLFGVVMNHVPHRAAMSRRHRRVVDTDRWSDPGFTTRTPLGPPTSPAEDPVPAASSGSGEF